MLEKLKSLFQRTYIPSMRFKIEGVGKYQKLDKPSINELINEYKNITYTCANINASSTASATMRLYIKRGVEVVDEVTRHPILDLFKETNLYDLLYLTTLYLDITGSAYWLLSGKSKDIFSQPQKIILLPTQHVTIKQDSATGQITAYEYTVNSQHQIFKPEDILHFKHFDLENPVIYGKSPAAAVFEDLFLMNSNRSYETALVVNRGRPEVVITTKETLSEEEKKRIEFSWNKKFQLSNAGGVFVASDGIDAKQFSFTPQEMGTIDLYAVLQRAVANAFSVPLPLIDSKLSPRAQLEAAIYQHSKYAVEPRLRKIESLINAKILSLYDSSLYIKFDSTVPEDEELKSRIRSSDVMAGIITRNEARLEIGYDAIEGGDDLYIPSSLKSLTEPEQEQEQENFQEQENNNEKE